MSPGSLTSTASPAWQASATTKSPAVFSIRPGVAYSRPRGIRQSKTRSRSSPVRSGRRLFLTARYRIEEMALIDALNQSVGKTYSAACPKVFGGSEFAGCKIALGPITKTGTLDGGDQQHRIRDMAALRPPTGSLAALAFTAGANAGLKPIGIKRHESDGTFEVFRVIPLSRGGWGRLR